MPTAQYRCYACDAKYPVQEIAEKFWGLWPVPHQCPRCTAPVQVFHRPTSSDAKRLVSAVTGLARLSKTAETPAEILRWRCSTPQQVDRILATVDRLEWDAWHAEFERYLSNASTADWNRANLALWPEVIRTRDDGSLRRTLEAAAAEVKAEKRADVAKWRAAHEARKQASVDHKPTPTE